MKKYFALLLLIVIFIFNISCNSNNNVADITESYTSQYIEVPTLYTDIFVPFTDYVSEKSFDFVKDQLSNFHYAIEIKDTSIYISDDLGHSISIVAKDDIICLVQYATSEKSIAVSNSLNTLETPIFITGDGNTVSSLKELEKFMFS